MVFWSKIFQAFKYPRHSASIISEIIKLGYSFFFENALNLMQIPEMQLKIQKKSYVFEIMAFKIVAVNSAYCCRNICHRQLMR